MSLHEIILPETKPEIEWVRGRALRKMSPTPNHSFLQGALVIALSAWAVGKGKVGPEWRFRIHPPGGAIRPLIPDVAYVCGERLRGLSDKEVQASRFAPDAAFEILSPGDRPADIEDKVALYLAAGTTLVVIVDPKRRSLVSIDLAKRRTFGEGAIFTHPELPGFTLSLTTLFSVLHIG